MVRCSPTFSFVCWKTIFPIQALKRDSFVGKIVEAFCFAKRQCRFDVAKDFRVAVADVDGRKSVSENRSDLRNSAAETDCPFRRQIQN